jgi:colicin import membrane protein
VGCREQSFPSGRGKGKHRSGRHRRCQRPGVIARRAVGSDEPFKEHAEIPTDLCAHEPGNKPKKRRAKSKKQRPIAIDEKAAKRAALAFEREQKSPSGSASRMLPRDVAKRTRQVSELPPAVVVLALKAVRSG